MFGFIEVTEKTTGSKTLINVNEIIGIIEDGSSTSISLRSIAVPIKVHEAYYTIREKILNAQ